MEEPNSRRVPFAACTMIFDPSMYVSIPIFIIPRINIFIINRRSKLASSSAWLPLLYDTVVLALTVNRTLPSLKNKNSSYVMKRLLEDGLIYYTCVLVFFCVWYGR